MIFMFLQVLLYVTGFSEKKKEKKRKKFILQLPLHYKRHV